MIYLIGGAMRCGKTKTARMLAKKLKVNWIQSDLLRTAIRESMPKDVIYEKFPLAKWELLGKDRYRVFEKHKTEALLENELTEAKSMWPGVRAFIKHATDEDEDYIIEGVHLLPSQIESLRKKPFFKDIRIVYLIKKDIKKIAKGIKNNDDPHDWLPDYIKTQKSFDGAVNYVREESLYFEREAKKYGFKVISTDHDFRDKIKEAVNMLSK